MQIVKENNANKPLEKFEKQTMKEKTCFKLAKKSLEKNDWL